MFYRLERSTFALVDENGHLVVRAIPADSVLEAQSSAFLGERLEAVTWEGVQVMVFAQDLRARTVLIARSRRLLLPGERMFGVGGATQRPKIVLHCALPFVAGALYSRAWHDVLARIFGWDDAWIATTIGVGIGSVLVGRRWFAKRSDSPDYGRVG